MAKIKTLNLKSQLESAGIQLNFNPIGTLNINKDKLRSFFIDIDSQQFIARFKWKGIPKNWLSWRIEQMLYNRGSLGCTKVGKSFHILPWVMSGGLNTIGLPTAITLITYNGEIIYGSGKNSQYNKFASDLTVNHSGEYDKKAQAIILYDRFTGIVSSGGMIPKAYLQGEIIEQIINRLMYLNINLVNSQGKTLIICKDQKQADVVKQELENLYSSIKNFAMMRSQFEVQVINNDIEYKEQQLWEDIVSWNNLRLESLGIQNSGLFNKKERQLTGEISSTTAQTNGILLNGLMARKLFVQQMKEQFKNDPDFQEQFKDFDVEINENFYNSQNQNLEKGENQESESDNE